MFNSNNIELSISTKNNLIEIQILVDIKDYTHKKRDF